MKPSNRDSRVVKIFYPDDNAGYMIKKDSYLVAFLTH